MSYLVLARKYRPQSFEDLVGQEHVARTLANAIGSGRVAHAFLFTGVRGVGKTTSARLLAKCLNCLGADGKATGPTAIPCQVCAACKEIAAGNDMDVQEIDGASYNGVDEVRRLQEGLAFRPARDRFKVYIVDEVHMLSNAAWNAFLKTLEEPPPHVKFIFATTEVHKVPATILSRCQRYDFKLISVAMIIGRLKDVLAQEKITTDDAALSIIAREAAGSMRDAMSLLDQVIAFSGNDLKGSDVARVLGVADGDALLGVARAVLSGDRAGALNLTRDLAEAGFDLVHLARHLLRQFRDLVVIRAATDAEKLVDRTKEDIAALKALSETVREDELLRVFFGFSKSFEDIARSGQPRMTLEMTLVRLAARPTLATVEEILSKVVALEARLGGGAAAGSKPGTGGPPGKAPSGASDLPSPAPRIAEPPGPPNHLVATASPSPTATAIPIATATAPSTANAPATANAPSTATAAAPAPRAAPRSPAADHFASLPTPSIRAPSASGAPPPSSARPSQPPSSRGPASRSAHSPEPYDFGGPPPSARAPGPGGQGNGPASARGPASAPPPPKVRSSDEATWRAIVALIRPEHAGIASMFEHAAPSRITPNELILAYSEHDFLATQVTTDEARALLTKHTRAFFGVDTDVRIELREAQELSIHSVELEKKREASAAVKREVAEHPLVRELVQNLGAELRAVRVPGDD